MNESTSNVWSELSNKTKAGESPRIGLAVATLVLGVVSIAMAIFVTGALFGVAGAIIGLICLAGKSLGKKMAGCGVALSILGIVLSCFFALIYYGVYAQKHKNLEDNSEKMSSFDSWIGKEAPDFTLTDVEGNSIKLSDFRGRRIVLNFWTTRYLRDRDAIAHFSELRKTVREEELVIIGMSRQPAEELRGVSRQIGINYPLVSIESLTAPYDQVYLTPTTFFIDRNGIIQSILEEYHDFEKLKSQALAPDYEKYETQEGQVLKSEAITSDD